MAFSPRVTSLPRVVARAVLLLCSACVALTFLTPAALAHDSLKSSSPASGAVVSGVREIDLEFHDRVSFPAVVLHDAAGKRFDSGAARADGPKVYEAVAGPVPPGSYVIAWRIVSSDGHPVEGEIPFTVAGSSSAGSSSVAAAPPVSPAATPSTANAGGEGTSGGGLPGWVWAGIVLLLIVAGGVGLRSARPARRTDPD
jgi:hypothetical protein